MVHPDPETIWQKYLKRAEPVIIDGMMWITVLAIMLIVFGVLKMFDAADFGHDRVGLLERIHYLASLGVVIIGAYDMLAKMASIAIGGGK